MKEKLKKIVKTGYGLGLLSLSQAKKMLCQVKKDLHLDDEESLRMAKALVASSEKASKDVLKMVDKNLSKALIRSRLVKKRELVKVKNKLVTTWKKVRKRGKR